MPEAAITSKTLARPPATAPSRTPESANDFIKARIAPNLLSARGSPGRVAQPNAA